MILSWTLIQSTGLILSGVMIHFEYMLLSSLMIHSDIMILSTGVIHLLFFDTVRNDDSFAAHGTLARSDSFVVLDTFIHLRFTFQA